MNKTMTGVAMCGFLLLASSGAWLGSRSSAQAEGSPDYMSQWFQADTGYQQGFAAGVVKGARDAASLASTYDVALYQAVYGCVESRGYSSKQLSDMVGAAYLTGLLKSTTTPEAAVMITLIQDCKIDLSAYTRLNQ